MVRMWGNIPLFTEPVNENRPQSDPDEVYNVIFSDLLYAVNNIPASAYPKSAAASNDGHITKYAASALWLEYICSIPVIMERNLR